MKKSISVFTKTFLAVCLLWGSVSQLPAYAADIELSYQAKFPERHIVVKKAIKPWFKNMEEKSGDTLKFTYFPPGALVKQPKTFDAVKTGAIDIGGANTARNPGKFPLNELVSLPLLFPSSKIGSEVVWRLGQEFPEWGKEFAGTTLLWQFTSAPTQIITVKKPVQTLEDLKGMKIIVWTPGMLKILQALGANPIKMPSRDSALALEKGLADGIAVPIPIMRPYKLNISTKYITLVDLAVTSFYAVMNSSKMKSLPSDIHKNLTDSTGILMARSCGEAMDKGTVKGIDWLKSLGFQFYTLSSEEKQKWMKAVMPLRDLWLKQMEEKGYRNIHKILERAENLSAELQDK